MYAALGETQAEDFGLPQNLVEIEARDDEIEFSIASEGGIIELVVHLEGASIDDARSTARAIADRINELLMRARAELVTAFLPVVNGGYLQEGDPPVTAHSFLERAVLSGLGSDCDGNLSFYFDDDDMLWGHQMILSADLASDDWSSTTWG